MMQQSPRFFRRSAHILRLALGGSAALFGVACGNGIYAIKANSASNQLAEARELGAEKLAPFEYYYAKEHYEEAERQAADADYGDAINLAEESETYAAKAIRLSKQAERGAGR